MIRRIMSPAQRQRQANAKAPARPADDDNDSSDDEPAPKAKAKAKAKAPAKPADDAMKAARLHHASLPERIGYLEKNIWDSAGNHHIVDNADTHVRELAAHRAAH